MKKTVIFLAIFLCFLSAFSQNLCIGTYFNTSQQSTIFLSETQFLKSDKNLFQGFGNELYLKFKIKDNFALNAKIGYSLNHLSLTNSFISSFQYSDIPISITTKANIFSFSNFKFYFESGISLAFCYNYSYNRVIDEYDSNLTGTISDYNFKSKWSYGFVNGIGLTYLIKSKFEIDVFVNYFSGINKLWENNSISIIEDGVQNTYTISSNGNSLNIGLGLGYCF